MQLYNFHWRFLACNYDLTPYQTTVINSLSQDAFIVRSNRAIARSNPLHLDGYHPWPASALEPLYASQPACRPNFCSANAFIDLRKYSIRVVRNCTILESRTPVVLVFPSVELNTPLADSKLGRARRSFEKGNAHDGCSRINCI